MYNMYNMLNKCGNVPFVVDPLSIKAFGNALKGICK